MHYQFEVVTSVGRRNVLKTAVAMAGMSAIGCSQTALPTDEPSVAGTPQQPNSSPDGPAVAAKRIAPGPPFVDRGFRLYGIVPVAPAENGATFMLEIQAETGRGLTWWHGTSRRLHPVPEKPGFNYVIWATKEEAARVGELASVKSAVAVGAEQIGEFGTPDVSRGRLAVRYFSQVGGVGQPKDTPVAATRDQIIQQWRDATKDVSGLVINPGPDRDLTHRKVGDVPTDQIVIHFSTPVLDPAVLKMVRQHPQTMAIRWGDLFTEFYCPPCGMG